MPHEDHVPTFDGTERVEVRTLRDVPGVIAVAHELGYALTTHRVQGTGGPILLRFVRDDGEPARARAAWARYHYGVNGAWWATAWPPHAPPGSLAPREAAKYRLKLFLLTRYPLRQVRARVAALSAALVAVAVWLLFVAWVLIPFCVALAALYVVANPVSAGRRATREAEYRTVLSRFEAQRVYWSHEGAG
ncbi:hypothetical protein [Streptomyces sedi]|uniref:hypothetical protein n=1 Tax=Streptomyces sedi TaxID=555059 RepID=UPI001476CF15|nr:hypothetical protein [Streptomyces sedi]